MGTKLQNILKHTIELVYMTQASHFTSSGAIKLVYVMNFQREPWPPLLSLNGKEQPGHSWPFRVARMKHFFF